jgi:hypothetical protein
MSSAFLQRDQTNRAAALRSQRPPVTNGVAAPIMAMIMLTASRRAVMFTLTKWLTVLGWLGAAIMAAGYRHVRHLGKLR